MAGICEGVRKDGTPCRAPKLGDGRWCFGHDPTKADERALARRRGGQGRATVARLERRRGPHLRAILDRLERVMTGVEAGTIEASRGGAIAALSRAYVTAFEAGELESRLEALERQITDEDRRAG